MTGKVKNGVHQTAGGATHLHFAAKAWQNNTVMLWMKKTMTGSSTKPNPATIQIPKLYKFSFQEILLGAQF